MAADRRQTRPPRSDFLHSTARSTRGRRTRFRPAGACFPSEANSGIFLSESDIEELSTLVRVGTPVQFLKKTTASR